MLASEKKKKKKKKKTTEKHGNVQSEGKKKKERNGAIHALVLCIINHEKNRLQNQKISFISTYIFIETVFEMVQVITITDIIGHAVPQLRSYYLKGLTTKFSSRKWYIQIGTLSCLPSRVGSINSHEVGIKEKRKITTLLIVHKEYSSVSDNVFNGGDF